MAASDRSTAEPAAPPPREEVPGDAGGEGPAVQAAPSGTSGEGKGGRKKGGSGTTGPGAGAPPRRRRSRVLLEAVAVVVVAVLVALGLRAFVVQTYYVPSGSMEPTIDPGDRILVDKLSYHFHSVHTGDIVVFATPRAEIGRCAGPPVPDLVKRVIGLPGQRISSANGEVYVNGKPLAEPWLPAGEPLGPPVTPMTVPANEYYVMGDNRTGSCDSRTWGPVPGSLIVGKVVAIFWPFSRFHWF